MTVVYVIRHAHRLPPSKTIPDHEISLSEKGKIQAAEEIGPALRRDIEEHLHGRPCVIDVYTSPYLRTQQTLNLGVMLGLEGLNAHYHTRDELRDRNSGEFYAMTKEERAMKWPRQVEWNKFLKEEGAGLEYFKPPGDSAENLKEVMARVYALYDNLLEHEFKSHPRKAGDPEHIIVFVTHNYIANVLAMRMKLEPIQWFAKEPGPQCGSIRKFESPTMVAMKDCGFIYGGPEEVKRHGRVKGPQEGSLPRSGG